MPSPLVATASDHDPVGSLLIHGHDFLPTLALAAGVVAVFVIVCAAIVITGYVIAAAVVLGLSALADTCGLRCRSAKSAEPAADSDRVRTKVVHLDSYRRCRQRSPLGHRHDDDPA